jgi:hypothetical protein
MSWDFFVVVGGSLVIALGIYFIGIRQEKADAKNDEKA